MLRKCGAYALTVAVLLLASCSAESRQDSEGGDGDHTAGRYETELRLQNEYEDFLRFLLNHQNEYEERNLNGIDRSSILGRNLNGIGGSSILGRNLAGIGGSGLLGRNLGGIGGSSMLGRNLGGIGGSSMLGRNLGGIGGSSMLGRNLNGIGGSTMVGRDRYTRFVDSLGGGNFVRNLDSIGGGNLVKKNLDNIGGPYLVKKHLDSIGGSNFVRNLDSIGGGNFVRELDSIGGQNPQSLELPNNSLVREVRETQPYGLLPYLLTRRHDYSSMPNRGKQDHWPSHKFSGYNGEGYLKRNFDEIDLSALNNLVRKRNFDEIDHTWLPFPHSKRSYSYDAFLDSPRSGSDVKRFKPDYPMDEIDLSSFPVGSKRSQPIL